MNFARFYCFLFSPFLDFIIQNLFKIVLTVHTYCVTQAFWFLEWHLDILILWALSRMGEFNKAEDLLKGLKSRWGDLSTLSQVF